MSVMVTVEWPAKPETLSEFLGLLEQALVDTRTYDGCENVQTYVEKSTGSVLLVEIWASEEHQQAYMKWRMETGLMDAIGGYLDSAPIARTFDIKSDV
ncbi:MAG: putative quinol monooxygenase [Luminiphilus sp.]